MWIPNLTPTESAWEGLEWDSEDSDVGGKGRQPRRRVKKVPIWELVAEGSQMVGMEQVPWVYGKRMPQGKKQQLEAESHTNEWAPKAFSCWSEK